MKLDKNNKYNQKKAIGLATIIMSGMILSGCARNNEEEAVQPIETPIVEVAETEPTKQVNNRSKYLAYFFETEGEVLEQKVEELDIKYPNALNLMGNVSTIVVRDADTNYKVLQTYENWDRDKKIVHMYDLFTEEWLFDLPYENTPFELADGWLYKDIDLTKITNKISYFDDKEIVEYGMCMYSSYFTANHIKDFSDRDGINYSTPSDKTLYYIYTDDFSTSTEKHTTKEMAYIYCKTVPDEFRVTSAELGLKARYTEEEKYADCYKMSEEEKEEIYPTLEVQIPEMDIEVAGVKTLIIKDSDNNYKVLNVFCSKKDGGVNFYNVFTNRFLFKASLNGNSDYTYDGEKYVGMDLVNLMEKLPYFYDKEIVEIGSYLNMQDFIENHIDELRARDGIDYVLPDDNYKFYLLPGDSYNTMDVFYTTREYADAYIATIPEEFRVTAKELQVGLEKSNEKVLVK